VKPEYRKVKVLKPHCPVCKQMLYGEGSMILPYKCKCGTWKWNFTTEEFTIIKEEENV
jgi:tRNA(Ile2) C34 agmatinyltransferase TiaS